jgi:hypothetical protein
LWVFKSLNCRWKQPFGDLEPYLQSVAIDGWINLQGRQFNYVLLGWKGTKYGFEWYFYKGLGFLTMFCAWKSPHNFSLVQCFALLMGLSYATVMYIYMTRNPSKLQCPPPNYLTLTPSLLRLGFSVLNLSEMGHV